MQPIHLASSRRPSSGYRLIALAILVTGSSAFAGALPETHTAGVPVLSSRPGAAYTIYLDPAGFTFNGLWNEGDEHNKTPGFTPSLNDVAPTGTFNATEQTQIKILWARVAQSYIGLNVNVTTVDPAAAGLTDAQRQAFYDATPNMMHTVLGSQVRAPGTPNTTPNNKWYSDGADGVSPGIGIVAGKVEGPTGSAGQHTNWMFTEAQAGAATGGVIQGEYIGGISAHENGHSFGLFHQGDYSGGGVNHINEYSFGDDSTGPNNYGTYIPIIGDANNRQRIAWRIGTNDIQNNAGVYQQQNDLKVMLATDNAATATSKGRSGGADLHFIEDGKGHSLPTAQALPLVGGTVDFTQAKGVIVPLSESDPQAMGAANYTQDWYSFLSDGVNPISLSATDSTDFLVPGVADSAGTLNSTLGIFSFNGSLVANSTEDLTTLIDTYTGTLPAGLYYAAVGSFGGHQQINAANYDPAYYFDTGAYFLTGTGFALAPEPTSMLFLAVAAYGVMGRRRSKIA